jgi:hypothetical protein
VGIKEDEQVGRAATAMLAVVAFELARHGRNGLTHMADQRDRARIEAHHRPLGIGGLGMEIEHVLYAGDIGAMITRRSSARSLPRTSVGSSGAMPAHCSSLSQNKLLRIFSAPLDRRESATDSNLNRFIGFSP